MLHEVYVIGIESLCNFLYCYVIYFTKSFGNSDKYMQCSIT